MQEVFIVDEIRNVVQKTNTKLAAANFGMTVYYDYGHPEEINQRLQTKADSAADKDKLFPLIILLTDIPITHNIVGFWGQARLRLLICNFTEAEYTSQERTDINFKPILHPIKKEFMNQLSVYGLFAFETVPQYTETDCYYYGSQINNKNQFNDRIDAIEITDLVVNITAKIC
jgi:hypothetical protein